MKKPLALLILLTFVLLTGCSMNLNGAEQSNYIAASDITASTKPELFSENINRELAVPDSIENTFSNMKSGLFSENENGDIIAPDGTEYIHLCGEGEGYLELLGKKQLIGKVSGEYDSEPYGFDIGLYACEQDTDRIMMLRYMPDSEWAVFYRKKSAPAIDITGKDLIRLELVGYKEMRDEQNMYSAGSEHMNCGKGISGRENVAGFFKDIKAEETAEAANLYGKVTEKDGTIRNCYELGKVYGFFQGENAAVKPYEVWSFDDKYYSITIDNVEYVLPKEYLEKLGYSKQ